MKIFKAVAEFQSVSKAARKLDYVQSNVSKRIEKIERELGCALFIRTNKGMSLLPAGEVFLSYCIEIIAIMDNITEQFINEKQTIRIGATQSISKHYLSQTFLQEKRVVRTKSMDELVLLLKQEELDFIILNREITDGKLKKVSVFEEEIAWLVSNHYSSEWGEKPVLISRDKACPYRKATLDYLAQQKEKNVQLIELDTLDILVSMVEENQALAVLPKIVLKSNPHLQELTLNNFDNVPLVVYQLMSNRKEYELKDIINQF